MNEGTTRYMPRIIDGAIAESLSGIGAVSIEGPRGCGKTAAAERVCKSALYLDDSSEGLSSRRFAETFPDAVLEGVTPRLIDEWEHVPELWDGVRCEIDRRARCGQFVFTQSMYPLHLSRCHPGTGRIARFRMRTMSLYETGDSSGEVSLKKLCDGETESILTRHATSDDIMRYILRGGWPEAVTSGSGDGGVAKKIVSDALRSCGQNLVLVPSKFVRIQPGLSVSAFFMGRISAEFACLENAGSCIMGTKEKTAQKKNHRVNETRRP